MPRINGTSKHSVGGINVNTHHTHYTIHYTLYNTHHTIIHTIQYTTYYNYIHNTTYNTCILYTSLTKGMPRINGTRGKHSVGGVNVNFTIGLVDPGSLS